MISRSVLFARFAGRDQELGFLTNLRRDSLARSRGALVSIVGEAGVGKSRLLAEFARAADPQSGAFVRVRCEEFPIALSPIVAMLRALQARRELIRSATVAAAAGLVTEGERFESHGGARKHTLFAAVVAAVRDAAKRLGSLTIVVEDVHWSDLSTLEALRAIARDIDDVPALVAVSYRPDDLAADPARAAALADLEREGFDRIVLAPLANADIISLAREATPGIPEAALRRIAELSEGRPYVAEELTRNVAEADAGGGGPIALSLRGAVLARVGRLAPDERAVIERAAVLGRNFSPGDLRAIGTPDEHLTPALQSATRLQLLEEREVNGAPWFRFRHELTREILYLSIMQLERRALHLAVADHLDAGGDRAAELAYHLAKAGDRERARSANERAGDAAAEVAAYSDAANLYARALEFSTLPDDVARLGRKLVHAFEYVGHHDPGTGELVLRTIERLGADGRRDDALAIALVALRRSITIPGHSDRAPLIDHATALVGPNTPADLRFEFEMMMAPAHWIRGRFREALDACERAQRCVPDPTPAQRRLLLMRRGAAHAMSLDLEAARSDLATYAAEWPDHTAEDPLFSIVSGAVRAQEGRTREARDAFLRASAAFERRGNDQRSYAYRCSAALHGAFLGEFQLCEELDAYERRHGMINDFMLVMAKMVRVRAVGGDPAPLLAIFEHEVTEPQTPELLAALGAHLAWIVEPGEARSIVTRTLRALPTGALFGAFADAAVALGNDEDAERAMARHTAEAIVPFDAPAMQAERALVAARFAHRAGERTRAIELAREAQAPALESGIWYFIVPAYELAGDLAAARSELLRIGASAELERFGRRHPSEAHAQHTATATLTKRERQIAAAIASGLSSREAAERLDISTRTVETHLTNLYRKLGIASRAELADIVAKSGGDYGMRSAI